MCKLVTETLHFISTEDGQLSEVLKEAHVPLWPNRFCQEAHPKQFGGSWVTENMFCAGHDQFGVDTCQVFKYSHYFFFNGNNDFKIPVIQVVSEKIIHSCRQCYEEI